MQPIYIRNLGIAYHKRRVPSLGHASRVRTRAKKLTSRRYQGREVYSILISASAMADCVEGRHAPLGDQSSKTVLQELTPHPHTDVALLEIAQVKDLRRMLGGLSRK